MKYRKGEFITVGNKSALEQFKPTTQCLWMWLCAYADNSGECWPSRDRLRRNIGAKSIRTVDYHMQKLIDAGLIVKKSRYNDKKQQSNYYQLMLVDRGAKNAPPTEEGCKKRQGGVQKTTHRTKPRTKPSREEEKKEATPLSELLARTARNLETSGIIKKLSTPTVSTNATPDVP